MIDALQLAASAALGACIGYGTNAIAIKSLFRPLRPRWYSLGWQGVVPRNRHKLADNIARVVGEDLLSREYLAEHLRSTQFQNNLQDYVQARVDSGLDTTLGALFSRLPASWTQGGLEKLMVRALSHLGTWSVGEEGTRLREGVAEQVICHLQSMELQQLVGTDQAQEAAASLGRALGRAQTRDHLTSLLQGELERVLTADRPLEELMPVELRDLLRERLTDQVPAMINRIADWLQTPENVEHISERILTGLESFAERNTAAGRLLAEAGLQLFGDRIRNWVQERLPHVASEYLHSPETRRRFEAQLLEGIDRFLGKSVKSLTAGRHQMLAEKISYVAGAWLTSDEVQQRLSQLLMEEYRRHADSRLRDTLPEGFWMNLRRRMVELLQVPADSVPEWGQAAADWLRPRLERSGQSFRSWVSVGPRDQVAFVRELSARGSELLQAEVPVLLDQFDIAELVRSKVMGYDLLRVERLVRDIISDQLRVINLLGALLGGMVGLLLPFLNAWIAAISGP